MKIDVCNCQRCGQDHTIDFQPLLNPVDEWKFWGMCENTSQPVLLRLTKTTEGEQDEQ